MMTRRESTKTDGKDDNLYRRFQQIEKSVVFLEDQNTTANATIETLESKIAALETKITELEGN